MFDENFLKTLQNRFNYSDEQLQMFFENPRNLEVLSKYNELKNTILVLTVVESHGCNSKHNVGDQIYFDGAGNILTSYSPEKICSYALNNALLMIFAANEFIYSGISPTNIQFKRCSCFDVGISCGGMGQITLELSAITQAELKQKHNKADKQTNVEGSGV